VDRPGRHEPWIYVFGEHELDLGRFQLRRNGAVVHLEPKVFDVLAFLVAHHDRVVPKEELLDHIWGHRFVSESALTTRLKEARRAVGDDGDHQRLIRTVRGRGYRFVAEVASVTAPSEQTLAPPAARTQHIRYCHAADGTLIAYATTGHGPPLVKAANWLTHLDLEWHNPVWSHWLERFSHHHTLVRYDERGCGLSQSDVGEFGFDHWVEDLGTVIDAAGLDRVPILGVSQGGAVAIAFAVRHPERVARLVLVGAYARGRLVRARTAEERQEAMLDLDVAAVAWRRDDDVFRQLYALQFMPDSTAQERDAFSRLLRETTTAENAVRFLQEFARIDVSDLATRVRCPTLVAHARGDLRVPASQAHELTRAIPGSRLVLLDSRNHLLTSDEPAWSILLDELDSFLGEP
jgi:pimeloyl-ACP methyl ester carboxylesterase/DNA-binding winged helix-turn-helix (wHTH) protein